ncbi:hypothetical protein HHL11_12525 [Ramlibacter sp. G-1-2-2]|uniref:Uncharacterized protein n=1 Tax=Ramlibacter agri TaxID=2728837 RepID=A0A848H7S0_9BURK|nr:hypothetical protein [Ramlibacter agri]NML44583.1 hypothetical protein [Ramlibacter agri]
MKVTYVSKGGEGPAYEIEADRHGNFTIRQDGRVVKRVSSLPDYVGRPRWGSKKLEQSALDEAKAAIDAHHLTER